MEIISISKEKNIVTVVTNRYTRKYDINLGSWLGRYNTPIKGIGISSKAFSNYSAKKDNNINFETMFSFAMSLDKYNNKKIILLDRVISFLNITNNLATTQGYVIKRLFYYTESDLDLFLKDFSKIMKFYNYQIPHDLDEYRLKDTIEFLESIIEYPLNRHEYKVIVENISKEYYKFVATYINRGALTCVSIYHIVEFFKKAKKLGITEFSKDYCYDYFKIITAYKLRENEIMNKTISERQSFSLNNIENVTFEIPTKIEDFVRLGNEFGNCLGGHELNSFIKTERRRVIILRNENWKIACDFENDGEIVQFYLPYNDEIKYSPYFNELKKIKHTLQKNLFELFG